MGAVVVRHHSAALLRRARFWSPTASGARSTIRSPRTPACIGASYGVEWCVVGLDRNWAYNPRCRWARPVTRAQRATGAGCGVAAPYFVLDMFQKSGARVSPCRQLGGKSCRSSSPALPLCSPLSVDLLGASPGRQCAQDHRQNEPGKFDYYMLVAVVVAVVLRRERRARLRPAPARNPQCGPRPFSFVVHGLWPQYERGFPEFCQVPAPRLNRNIVSSMLDLMPAPSLIYHEWDRHGTCSGLPPAPISTNIRKARAVVKIPPQFLDAAGAADGDADGGRGRVRQGQSGARAASGIADLLRQPAARRGAGSA